MKEDIMSIVGKLVFILLCAKYRNDQDNYLAIMKIDRMGYNYGFDSCSYSSIIPDIKSEQGFLNNFGDKTPIQYLLELQSNTSVGGD